MKKNLFFFAAIAAAALASCTKETISPSVIKQAQEPSYGIIKAVVDQDGTKLNVNGIKFAFEIGDGISVFRGENHGNVWYRCDSLKDGIAYFGYGGNDDNPTKPSETINELIATFPQRSPSNGLWIDGAEKDSIRILVPVTHKDTTIQHGGFDPTAIPMVAYATDTNGVLHFKHTCGILELTLKGTAKISEINLSAESTIGGACRVAYTDDEPIAEMIGKTTTANYTYKDVQLTSDGVKFYFGLPVGTYNITFTFTDDHFGTMTKTATGLTIERGVMVPTSLDYVATPATDLCKEGYANCYVIGEAGAYCFDIKTPDGNIVENVASADWVWATSSQWNPASWDGVDITGTNYYNTLINKVKLIDGKIYVNAPMTYTGNAIIGALDKDGKLLWSWHLWLTNNLGTVKVGDYEWMDRNLGAGYVTDVTSGANIFNASRGLYYQAGRKDPVLGAHGNGNNDVSGKEVTGSTLVKNYGNAIYQYNTNISGLVEWQVGSTKLSTDLIALQNPTLLVAQANLPNLTVGTIWTTNSNPCPYGYKVATVAAFKALGTFTETESEKGNQKQVASGNVVFSLNGYRNQSDFKRKNCNTDTRIWLYDTRTDLKANYAKIVYDKDKLTTTASTTNSGRANGNSVRCIKATE